MVDRGDRGTAPIRGWSGHLLGVLLPVRRGDRPRGAGCHHRLVRSLRAGSDGGGSREAGIDLECPATEEEAAGEVVGHNPRCYADYGTELSCCLLYTSDAADEEDSVDIG